MDNGNRQIPDANATEIVLQTWVKPEIISFEPVKAAEGISYNPKDGIQNLT